MSVCNIDKDFAKGVINNKIQDTIEEYDNKDVFAVMHEGNLTIHIATGKVGDRADEIRDTIASKIHAINRKLIDDIELQPIKLTYYKSQDTLDIVTNIDIGGKLLKVINEINYVDTYNAIVKAAEQRSDDYLNEWLNENRALYERSVKNIDNDLYNGLKELATNASQAQDILEGKLILLQREIDALLSEKVSVVETELIQLIDEHISIIRQNMDELRDLMFSGNLDSMRDFISAMAYNQKIRAKELLDMRNKVISDKVDRDKKVEAKYVEATNVVNEELNKAFNTYINHLKKKIIELHTQIKVLKRKIVSNSNDEDIKQLKELTDYYDEYRAIQSTVNSEHNESALLSYIDREINFVINMLKSGGDINNIFSRIDFLNKMLLGVGLDNEKVRNAEFSTLSSVNLHSVVQLRGKLQIAVNLFSSKMKVQLVKNLLSNDAVRNFMNEHKISAESIEEFLKYLKGVNDASLFDVYFKGVGHSDADEGLLPQILKAHFEQVRVRRAAEVDALKNELKEAHSKLKNGTDFVFEKDSNGKKTGYIISFFRSSWNILLKGIDLYDNSILGAKRRIAFIRKHGELINYTLLPEVYNKFSNVFINELKNYNATEALKYQSYLKNKLGDMYDTYVASIISKLEKFHEYSHKEHTNLEYPYANIYNPFDNFYYFHKRNELYRLEYMELIPAKERHYNRAYSSIKGEDKEYLDKLTDLYQNYIGLYIPNYNSMSYGKFAVGILDNVINSRGDKISKLKILLKHIKGLFINTKGATLSEDILSTYVDRQDIDKKKMHQLFAYKSEDAIRQYALDLGITLNSDKDVTKAELIDEFVNTLSIDTYHSDINTITDTMLDLAGQMATRTEMLPIAQSYLLYFNSVSPAHTNAYKKMVVYTNQIIKGMRSKDLSFFSEQRGKINIEEIHNIKDMLRVVNNKQWSKLLSIMDEKVMQIIKKFAYTDITKIPVEFKYDNKVYKSFVNSEGVISYVVVTGEGDNKLTDVVSQDKFEEAYARYIVKLINNTGIHLSIASLMRGINTIIVSKYLAFNSSAGVINRWQGINDNSIADASGYYWKTGNLGNASRFLQYINLYNTLGNLGNIIMSRHKREQLSILRMMIDKMGILQTHSSDYDRNRRKKIFSLSKIMMTWAIDHPEFKNQLDIFLSILQDVSIKDKNGKSYPFFTSKGFTAYTIKNRQLVLKDEFATEDNINMWQRFSTQYKRDKNDMVLFLLHHINAVSHIQSNYDKYDTMTTINNVLLSSMLMLKRWMVSGIQQRFDTGRGYDLVLAKKRKEGRITTAIRNPVTAINYLLGTVALSVGMPMVGIPITTLVAGSLALGLYRRIYIKGMEGQVRVGSHIISEMAGFYLTAIYAALNLPLRILSKSMGGQKYIDAITYDKLRKVFNKNGERRISDRDIGNLKALATEFGNKLFFFTLAVSVLAVLYDDDDDEYSKKRRLYNYISNRLAVLVYDGAIFLNPSSLLDGTMSIPAITYFTNVLKLSGDASGLTHEDDNSVITDRLSKALPLPNELLRLTKGELFQDKKDFYSDQSISRTAKHIATGGESTAKGRYIKLRKNISTMVRDIGKNYDYKLKTEDIRGIVDNVMSKKLPNNSYESMVEIYKSRSKHKDIIINNINKEIISYMNKKGKKVVSHRRIRRKKTNFDKYKDTYE